MMFLKPFHIKTQTSIKGSDRKKLRAEIGKLYPCLTSEDQNDIIPAKEQMTVTKLSTHSGDTVIVYSVANNPIFFEAQRTLFPTVYTLWKYLDLLPVFVTFPPVFQKLSRGADLMLPGVVVKGEVTPSTFKHIDKGAVCSINLVGNRSPVAVGTTLLSGSDMFDAGMKGKGIHPIHLFGDELWKLGDKSNPPNNADCSDEIQEVNSQESDCLTSSDRSESPFDAEPSSYNTDSGNSSDNISKLGIGAIDTEAGAAVCGELSCDNKQINTEEKDECCHEEAQDSIEDPDSLLEFCFKCAIKTKLKKADLPILTSNFFRNCLLPYSQGKHFDIKKTRYKKLSRFLSAMQEEEYIKVEELSNGVEGIVDFDKSHIGLRGIDVPDIADNDPGNSSDEPATSYEPPIITEMVAITNELLPLFKEEGYVKGSALTAVDFKKSITQYVKNNSLHSETEKGHVRLDPVLAGIALNKTEGDVPTLRWDDLFSRLLTKTKPVYQIVFQGKEPVIIKGKVQPVTLQVKQRGSNKKVTLIDNLETFHINPKEFAHKIQIGLSCSTSVAPSAEKNLGVQVTIQGNQVQYIGNLLIDVYKISRKYIQGLEKAPKGRKK